MNNYVGLDVGCALRGRPPRRCGGTPPKRGMGTHTRVAKYTTNVGAGFKPALPRARRGRTLVQTHRL
ncbi:MAG: hypothetical protein LBM98_06545 [Oscillospiraceae bacterium]|nr:hypothetical protein [Oscillospiraceae bacterium]